MSKINVAKATPEQIQLLKEIYEHRKQNPVDLDKVREELNDLNGQLKQHERQEKIDKVMKLYAYRDPTNAPTLQEKADERAHQIKHQKRKEKIEKINEPVKKNSFWNKIKSLF